MGRIFDEYNDENADEGLRGYIKEKEDEIISKWQNESLFEKKLKRFNNLADVLKKRKSEEKSCGE